MRLALTGARAPATLELAHLLANDGIEVDLVDSAGWAVGRWSRRFRPLWRIPSPRHEPDACARRLRALARDRRWHAIVPTCEEVFHLARVVRDDADALGAPLWAPPAQRLARLHHKGAFVSLARDAALPVPETHERASAWHAHEPDAYPGAWVLKPAWSRFGTRVHLLDAHDEWPAQVRPTREEPWILQRRLEGRAWCTWSVARAGTLVLHSAYEVEATAGRIGAAIAFTMREHAAIERWVATFVAAHALTGQFAFDFIDTADGPLPLECNPRLTSGVHGYRGHAGVGAALVHAFAPAEGGPLRDVLRPTEGRRFTSALALRTYGHRVPAGYDLMDVPGDPWPRRLQLLSYGWLMARALGQRQDPRACSTEDIEWNGEGS